MTRITCAAAVVVVLAACSFGFGISRDRAIQLATAVGGPEAEVVRANTGPLGGFAGAGTLPNEPRNREVWGVVFAGDFPFSCPITGNVPFSCEQDASTMLVVLDGRTGEVLYAVTPAQ